MSEQKPQDAALNQGHQSCSCDSCKSACNYKPGWFAPGEAELAAKNLGQTLPEFFKSNLGVDWWCDSANGNTFVLAPAIVGHPAGEEYPGDPRGACVFFKDERCSIYGAHPKECRDYMHGESHTEVKARHKAVADEWKAHQGQITELLGEEPHAEEYDGGPLSFFSSWL